MVEYTIRDESNNVHTTGPYNGETVEATFSFTTGIDMYRWQFSRTLTGAWSDSGADGNATRTVSVPTGIASDYRYRISWRRNNVWEYATTWVVVIGGTRPAAPLPTPAAPALTAYVQRMDVGWQAIANATDYKVRHRVTTPQGTWTEITVPRNAANALVTTLSIPNLTGGVQRDFQLQALGDGMDHADSEWSPSAQGTPIAPKLNAPTLSLEPGDEAFTATWTDVANEGGYRLEWDEGGTIGNTPDSHNTGAGVVTHTAENLTNGTQYTVQVKATSTSALYRDSDFSSVAMVTPMEPRSPAPTVTYQVRDIDNGLRDDGPYRGETVTAIFSSEADITAFFWQYQNPGQVGWTDSATLVGRDTKTLTISATATAMARYRISWERFSEREAAQTAVTVIGTNRPGDPLPTPEAPTLQVGVKSLTAVWDAIAGAVSYRVGYRQGTTGAWTEVTSSGTNIILTGLRQNRLHQVRIMAIANPANNSNSAWGPHASATPENTAITVTYSPRPDLSGRRRHRHALRRQRRHRLPVAALQHRHQ